MKSFGRLSVRTKFLKEVVSQCARNINISALTHSTLEIGLEDSDMAKDL